MTQDRLFEFLKSELTNDIKLLSVGCRSFERNDFGQKAIDYLEEPTCPMWCMGIFCLEGYAKQISHVNPIPLSENQPVAEVEADLDAFEPGRVFCTWPQVSGRFGPPDQLQYRATFPQASSSESRDSNLRKIIGSIKSVEKRKNIRRAVEKSKKEFDVSDRDYVNYMMPTPRKDHDYDNSIKPVFCAIEYIFNMMYKGTGLVFDMDDVTKTEYFSDTRRFNQLNVRIQSDSFGKYISPKGPKKHKKHRRPKQPVFTNPVNLKTCSEDDRNAVHEKNHNKTPPCATLLVASGAYPQQGGGYGAVANSGIPIPPEIDVDGYMGDISREEKIKLKNMCRLRHYMILDECFKVGIDRQCKYHVSYDRSFWQINRLSEEPDFSNWKRNDTVPHMTVSNFNEDDIKKYPEVKYDYSRLLFCEDPNVFYELLCTTADSFFDTFPEFEDEDRLIALMNNDGEPDGELDGDFIRYINSSLRQTIKERGPLFRDYLRHYDEYHEAPMSKESHQLLICYDAKDFNSCTIVSDLSDPTQEAYEVDIDDLELGPGMGSEFHDCTFKLLLFPIVGKRYSGGDPYQLRHGILEFKLEVEIFKASIGSEYAGKMYDYGKLQYIDEYGNEQVKLFIVKQKAYGRKPIEKSFTDRVLLEDLWFAFHWNRKICLTGHLMKMPIVFKILPVSDDKSWDLVREEDNDCDEAELDCLSRQGIHLNQEFRIANKRYAKWFGFITETGTKDLARGWTWIHEPARRVQKLVGWPEFYDFR